MTQQKSTAHTDDENDEINSKFEIGLVLFLFLIFVVAEKFSALTKVIFSPLVSVWEKIFGTDPINSGMMLLIFLLILIALAAGVFH